MQPRLILASRSPQREAILSRLGLEFEVVPSGVDEIESGEPWKVVTENARLKAQAVAERIADPNALVLGGDTVIVHAEEVIGKPESASQAAEFMRRLSGERHLVLGGLAIVKDDETRIAACGTEVTFRKLTEEQVALYVATDEWRDRSGGYAIQQGGSILIQSIEGDYLNIIGLSVNQLVGLAPELGIEPDRPTITIELPPLDDA